MGMDGEVWREKAAKGALNHKAQIERNRQEYAKVRFSPDIMSRAQPFRGKARRKREKLKLKI